MAWELAETDKVDLPEPATDVGLKLAVTPLGNPLKLRLTAPVKPFTAAMVTVYEVELVPPSVTVCELGVAEMVKSPAVAEFTTSVTLAECDRAPLVPVMVSV